MKSFKLFKMKLLTIETICTPDLITDG